MICVANVCAMSAWRLLVVRWSGLVVVVEGVILMNGQFECRHGLESLECISGIVRWCAVGEMDTMVLLQ